MAFLFITFEGSESGYPLTHKESFSIPILRGFKNSCTVFRVPFVVSHLHREKVVAVSLARLNTVLRNDVSKVLFHNKHQPRGIALVFFSEAFDYVVQRVF